MKRMRKRLLSLLLCFCMVAGLLPVTAGAAEPQVFVNGVDLVTAEDHTVKCGDGTAKYDPDTCTLTLDGATIDKACDAGSNGACGIYTQNTTGLTFILKGTNTVESAGEDFDSGVYITRTLTVEGDGSLTAVGKEEGIIVLRSFTINSGTITGTATGKGLSGSYHSGVRSQADLTINGGKVTGIANAADSSRSFGVNVELGSLYIKGGTVTGEGANGGIRSERHITITGNPTVTATSTTAGNAISAGDSSYYQLTVNGTRYEPLETAEEFKVENGHVTGAQIWTPPVWVNGVKISAGPGYTVECGDGTAVYDPDTGTLTLTGATIGQSYEDDSLCAYGIYAEGDLTLVLEGTNTVKNTDNPFSFGVYIDGSLTVSGTGTLTAEGEDSGIMVGVDLTVSGGTISGTSSADDGTGIFAGNNLTVSGGTVNGSASGKKGDGIYVDKGALTVTGGTVEGTATGSSGNGINVVKSNMTVEGGTVEGTASGSGSDNGISARFLEVKSGSVEGTTSGSGSGIYVRSDLTVSGGNVTGSASGEGSDGIFVGFNDLTVSGGSVTGIANGNDGHGIYAYYGDIIITGTPNVTARSATAGKAVEVRVKDSELLVDGTRYTPTATATAFKVENGQVTGAEKWTPDIWVNNVRISTPGNNTVNCGGGTAVYDLDTNTLTLTDATINTKHEENITGGTVYHSFGIYADSDLTLVLAGENTVQNTADPFDYGVYVDGSLTVKGTGRLTAGGKLYGIYVEKNMTTVESGAVEGTSTTTDSDYAGIGVRGALTVSGGSVEGTATGSDSYGIAVNDTMTVTGGSVGGEGVGYGIFVSDSLTVSGSGTVEGTTTGSSGRGIYTESSLTASGGSVTGTANGSSGEGIYTKYSLTASGSSTVTGTAAGEDGWGINVDSGSLTVKGGTVTGEGDSTGIYTSGLTISSGSVTGIGTGEGNSCGIDTTVLNLRGGTVTGKGGNVAIVAYGNGEQTADKLIVLSEDCDLNGYEAQTVVVQSSGNTYTYASFAETGNKLAYKDSGFTNAVKEITLKAPDLSEPEEPGGSDEEPDQPGGDEQPGGGSSSGSGSSGGGSSSGNKTETTTNPDGSTTTTVTKPDGSTTETTKNPDGSQQVVDTDKDGNVTTTVTDTDGNKTEVVEKTDGSAQTTVTNKDGSTSTTTVDETGKTEAQVKLPDAVVNDAADKGEAVALPMPQVSATTDTATAPAITVTLPGSSTSVKVEIPVENVTPGAVAVIVKADGTEEVIKTTLTTENGVAVTLSDGDTVKIVDNTKDFDDVADSYWGSDVITFATSRELFNGTSETTFTPEGDMTRAMVVTVLARYEGVDTSTGDTWYDAGRDWAMENKVSDGTNMEDPVTREQLAVMLYRYAGEPAVTGTISGFADADEVSDWAQDAMLWATQNGIITGMGDNALNPQGTATRAQVATMLARFVAYTA